MNKIELKVGGNVVHTVETPSKWNEITGEQIRFFLNQKNRSQNVEEILERTVQKFLGRLPINFPGFNKAQMEDLCKQHLWLFEKTDLIKQLLPSITIAGVKYLGPSDGLTNLKFWEYLKANEYFTKYTTRKLEVDFHKFLACIYRPAVKSINKNPETYTGDLRERFNDNLIEIRSQKINQIDNVSKECVILFWKGCCESLQLRFPEAFEGGDIKNEYGATGLADMMAGPKFGTISNVKDAWLYEVLVSACNLEKLRKLNKK